MDKEQWRWIVGMENIAAVSTHGRAFCDKGGGLLAPYFSNGVVQVRLWRDGPRISLGREILRAFREDKGPDYTARHINTNVYDNRLHNLGWVSKTEAARIMLSKRIKTRGKILPDNARQRIRTLLRDGRLTYDELADMYGVSSRTIRRIGEET